MFPTPLFPGSIHPFLPCSHAVHFANAFSGLPPHCWLSTDEPLFPFPAADCVLAILCLGWALIKPLVSFTSIISNIEKAEKHCLAWPLAACWYGATGVLPSDKLYDFSLELLSSKMLDTNRIAGACSTSTAEGMIPPVTGVLNTTPADQRPWSFYPPC